jgi:hypothetical protein
MTRSISWANVSVPLDALCCEAPGLFKRVPGFPLAVGTTSETKIAMRYKNVLALRYSLVMSQSVSGERRFFNTMLRGKHERQTTFTAEFDRRQRSQRADSARCMGVDDRDESLKQALRCLIREGEHAMAFTKRMCELGHAV